MNFREYVLSRRAADNIRGDFINDAKADRKFPEAAATWGDVETYLLVRGACREAVQAGRKLWNEYARNCLPALHECVGREEVDEVYGNIELGLCSWLFKMKDGNWRMFKDAGLQRGYMRVSELPIDEFTAVALTAGKFFRSRDPMWQ